MILVLLILAPLGLTYFLINPSSVVDLLAWVIGIVGAVLNFIMIPINAVIAAAIPGFENAMASVLDMVDIAATYLYFILDASMLPPAGLGLIAAYLIFVPGLTISLWLFKLPLKWKRALLG